MLLDIASTAEESVSKQIESPKVDNTIQIQEDNHHEGTEELDHTRSPASPSGVAESTSSSGPTEDSASTPGTRTANAEYVDLGQQAVAVAANGGVWQIGQRASRPPTGTDQDQAEHPVNPVILRIGRGLFISLHVVTWEEDPSIVLEVGWAAVWWQKKLGEVAEAENEFEETSDRGHYM